MKLTIFNRIKLAFEVLTVRSGHPHTAQEKQLSTFMRGYDAGMGDNRLLLSDEQSRIMELIERYGGIDGAHHKTWVIDQISRAIKGRKYNEWVIDMKYGEDGPDTYAYDTGIAP